MLSDVAKALLEPFLQAIFEVVFHLIGRIIVAVITLDRVACDFWERGSTWSEQRHIYGLLGLYRREGRDIFLSPAATSLIGCLPFICFFVWLYFIYGRSA